MPSTPSVRELLEAAVGDIGGVERPGQLEMADAVAAAFSSEEHLLVQAGTGTGKSLAYLVPALLHRRPVVVSTATLALQAQLVRRDLPRLVDAAEPVLGRRPEFAILKGRNNYVCKHRLGGGAGGMPQDDGTSGEGALFEVPAPSSQLGKEVLRAREWAADTDSGDRDDLVPGVGDRAWAQISVTSRECLGATRCPEGPECFAERARERAAEADVVITNHALLAIDALESIPVLPDHGAVVIDEAHDLVDRVSSTATAEITVPAVERVARAAARVADERQVDILLGVAEGLAATLNNMPEGPLNPVPPLLAAELGALRDAARNALVSISTSREDTSDVLLAKKIARTGLEEISEVAAKLATPTEYDVAWLAVEDRRGRVLRVAPLSVAGLLRSALFGTRTVVLTSATLAVGGGFDVAARSVGLSPADSVAAPPRPAPAETDLTDEGDASADDADAPQRWRGLDVGSPFDYGRQGILYVARHLPTPGRDGLSPAVLDELADLVEAAGGRTLGLFSSRRAAEWAAAEMRERLKVPVLCQGDDTLTDLVNRFAEDPATCLFGTLSLWQGVDVPGESCQLVVMDRIPFPRPDEPLSAARARAVDAAGGNGFLSVSAAHAGVKLAQGAGRLIRRSEDRGVVAILDSRLANARYGSFLRASLPPFWYTTDRAVALGALKRLADKGTEAASDLA
ncbi:MAG TPA: ATP-dependent DNA helicase [Sporichthya sp.]|nr:ATP-dependent DNA helicase [Sporichthya sp.]